MTARQKRFAENYVQCGNGAEAARQAGYTKSYAEHRTDELLRNVEIQEYIAELNEKITNEKIASASDIKMFWTDIMRNDDEPTKNRIRASELLAKTEGMFSDEW